MLCRSEHHELKSVDSGERDLSPKIRMPAMAPLSLSVGPATFRRRHPMKTYLRPPADAGRLSERLPTLPSMVSIPVEDYIGTDRYFAAGLDGGHHVLGIGD